MAILIFFIIISAEKRIGFYKLSFCFFYFNHIPRIPIHTPYIPTLIRIPILIPALPPPPLAFPPPFPSFPSFRSPIPHSGFYR